MQTLQKAAKTLRRNLIAQLLYKIKYSISTAYSRTLGVFFQNSDLLPKFHNLKNKKGLHICITLKDYFSYVTMMSFNAILDTMG